jgi:type I restriction enzyme, S subunit
LSARTVRLNDICEFNPRMPKSLDDNAPASFLPMAAVSENGLISFEEERSVAEVKKGYTYFERNDVLVAKITPCFENGKAARTASLSKPFGFGSTEFHVLRPADDLSPDYLFYKIWNASFRELGANNMTGSAGQKRVPVDFLKRLEIRLPPLDEQRRLAAILDKADALRRKRKRALGLLDGLIQSIFLKMFGDPITNPRNYRISAFESLLETSPNFGSMIPPQKDVLEWLSLRVANIQNWALTLDDAKYIDLPKEALERHTLRDGDIVLARAIASEEHLGKCVVVRSNGRKWAFDSHLMRIRLKRNVIDPMYVRELLRTPGGRQIFLRSTRKTTIQYNINTKELRALQIPVPPIDMQRDFVSRVNALEAVRSAFDSSAFELDALFSSLQSRAFSGQL